MASILGAQLRAICTGKLWHPVPTAQLLTRNQVLRPVVPTPIDFETNVVQPVHAYAIVGTNSLYIEAMGDHKFEVSREPIVATAVV